MGRKKIDHTGECYGSLTVLNDIDDDTRVGRYVSCKCVCGSITEVHLSNLRKDNKGTKSCGCVGKHGGTGTRLHNIWQNMKQRCYNYKHTNFKHYGAIGVTICDAWLNDFVSFRNWSLSNGYSDNLSIDRIKGALIYSPNTCRWANQETQSRNQRARPNTSSKYKGVCLFSRTQQWMAYITVKGKRIHLGYFNNQKDAARVRDTYIIQNNLSDFVLNEV